MNHPSPTDDAAYRVATEGPLESLRFAGLDAGPDLLVLGAVHGNEVCGPRAIERAIAACRAGELLIRRGAVTFVPVANPKAYWQRSREGDRNLNRSLAEKPVPADYEDRIGNRLCDLLRRHDVLLDIHSFRSEGEPFTFFGPEEGSAALRPFRHAAAEGALAAALGTRVAIHGWLENYERLIAIRNRLGFPPGSIAEGYGTTEYIRFQGGYGVTLECGTHDDPAAIEVGYRAIVNTFAHLGLTDDTPAPRPEQTVIHIVDIVVCEAAGDRLEGRWRTGDPVVAGTVIARRASGEAVHAPSDGFIIFPHPGAKPGEGICHFGVTSRRAI
ncbi:succinylglutamate desuccinylase/aspartoacylase domain-containing protein [Phreatobacter sp. AB_2022a]|uniref:succinylglutamate desuccinylase/aspartoacylase domain-containing protein n=1 Tax=Phreatobacter sp. AB_2022a TaxID=3003134 RepID=UPI002286E3AC|nr:succinylglutamate desuccinylase/aspartoacylase family protein [Phreatobacter sp. AB_2022a]MCZ0733885.1 succinylglutamate desuccinylase/aspartoacylase family protein [Phreatobacter sp. AB_2022a]